jgi:D-3-phosphoglycerate dehydrogenase
MAARILVTPRSVTKDGHPSLQRIKAAGYEVVLSSPGKQPGEEELLRLLPGCVGYLAGVEKITQRVLQAGGDLKVISRNGTGVDNIDLEAAAAQGITVCRAIGANARGVAELAMGLILSLARSMHPSDRAIKSGGWERRLGIELEDLTLGIVGCGKIGRLLAKFALGMDMHVLAFDPFPDRSFRPSSRFQFVPLAQLIEQSQVISLHCPAAPDGKPVLDADAFAKMRRGTLIVNTARHELIDTTALAAAIESGHVGGVALDVFETEPPEATAALLHDRVIATPHIGGFTHQSVARAMDVAVDNLLQALESPA